jgi:hypothetical protein
MAKVTPMSEAELHHTLLNLAISLMTQPDAKLMPRTIRLMENHVRNCAACAALMQPTDFSSGEHRASVFPQCSTVVDMRQWLARKSREKSNTQRH